MLTCTHLDQIKVTKLPESVDDFPMLIPDGHGETRIPPSPLGG